MLNYIGFESVREKLLGRMEVMVNQSLRSWSTKSSTEVKSSSAEMAANFSLKELCGFDASMQEENMSKKFAFMQAIMCIPVNIPGTAFHTYLKNQKGAMKLLREMLHARIKLRENDSSLPMDLLDQIVDDMKTSGEEFLTESFVIVMLFATLLASFEPVSAVLSLAMVFLTDHPLVVNELREEYERVLKNRENAGSPLTWTEYKSMTFTHQVVYESLRIANSAPGLLRKVIKDIDVNGYIIPEGWTLICLPSYVHMDPEIYEDPLVFNPWRWNGKPPTTKNFMPFGGGIRSCVGSEYTKAMIGVFIHVLITKFSWTKIKGGEVSRMPVLTYPNGFHVKISENDPIKTNA
ncbi:cytochrome P450 87A3-like [Papaver somniferum]|uniref:cytochrome P450 87A3-like n=1 Tax=Papaver somniferum TaxID=3469 RepID=UPI000E6F75E0|nr:cytochrome P450 87A3-like [Papaver somniferum]